MITITVFDISLTYKSLPNGMAVNMPFMVRGVWTLFGIGCARRSGATFFSPFFAAHKKDRHILGMKGKLNENVTLSSAV